MPFIKVFIVLRIMYHFQLCLHMYPVLYVIPRSVYLVFLNCLVMFLETLTGL